MYLSNLKIKNFRCVKDLDISFQKGVNAFVGKNNTGKSSILDAIRLVIGQHTNYFDPIWITEDDFYKEKGSDRAESFSIELHFNGLSEKQRVSFFEIIDFDLASLDKSTAIIRYSASWPIGKNRVTIKRCGGPDVPDMPEVPQHILDNFSVTYLPALRNVESALAPGMKSQLALLLRDITSKSDDDVKSKITAIVEKSNEELSSNDFIKNISENISTTVENIAGSDAQKSGIKTAETDFLKILRTLQIQMDGEPITGLSSNGLGLNNLLYIAVVLLHLQKVGEEECPLLLVEEPEAHLHPQMALALSRYLKNIQKETKPQIILTTHSPSLVADLSIDDVLLLYKKESVLKCNSLKRSGFSEIEKRMFSRLMDVTRSTLYFAKGVILVEGISETILLPAFAERLNKDLRKKQISVIPICGVSFEIFKRLFNENVFDIPVAIITDSDPKKKYSDDIKNWETAYIDWDDVDSLVCDRTKILQNLFNECNNAQVFVSCVTLEYDLALAGDNNALVMAQAWENSYYGTPHNFTINGVNGKTTKEDKALYAWRGICLSNSTSGKGNLASYLAEELIAKEENGLYKNDFIVPSYIKDAINFVCERVV